MTIRHATSILSVIFAVAAAPTQAADALVDVADEGPGFSWTGGYVGLQAGYLSGDSHYLDSSGGYADPDPDGFMGGLYAGYNYQMANDVIVGVDADFSWANADDFGTGYAPGGVPLSPLGIDEDISWSAAVRGRLGYAVDRFLPYIAGGVAFADVDYQQDRVVGGPSFSDTMVGWTLGAGVDYAFTDNLIGRFEYRYTDFGTSDFTIRGSPGALDLTTNDIRFGIAYKF